MRSGKQWDGAAFVTIFDLQCVSRLDDAHGRSSSWSRGGMSLAFSWFAMSQIRRCACFISDTLVGTRLHSVHLVCLSGSHPAWEWW